MFDETSVSCTNSNISYFSPFFNQTSSSPRFETSIGTVCLSDIQTKQLATRSNFSLIAGLEQTPKLFLVTKSGTLASKCVCVPAGIHVSSSTHKSVE